MGADARGHLPDVPPRGARRGPCRRVVHHRRGLCQPLVRRRPRRARRSASSARATSARPSPSSWRPSSWSPTAGRSWRTSGPPASRSWRSCSSSSPRTIRDWSSAGGRGVRAPAFAEQFAPLKNLQVWRFSLYYFFVFGAFVALALWLPHYLIDVYGVDVKTAGMAAASFSLSASLFRAYGGHLSDKFGARAVMYWTFGVQPASSSSCCPTRPPTT